MNFEEQIMSKDKYPSKFPCQKVAIVLILEIFFATRAVLKIEEYSRIFPSFSWGVFGHVACFDQSIKVCIFKIKFTQDPKLFKRMACRNEKRMLCALEALALLCRNPY